MYMLWTITAFILCIALSHAYSRPYPMELLLGFGRRKEKVDCVISQSWSAWEGPNGFGGYERYKRILVKPKHGGKPCPTSLVERKAGPIPTVKQVARNVETNFLRRGGQRSKRNLNPFIQLVNRQTGPAHYKSRDLLVILDSSGSIGPSNFAKAKNDIAELLGLLCPKDGSNDPFMSSAEDYHQAAFIQYSGYVKEEFDFNDKHPTSTLKSAIKSIPYIGGSTATGSAFQHAIRMFDSTNKGLRNSASVKKEVLILTDGLSNTGPNAVQAARDLRLRRFGNNEDEVEVYALVIGPFSRTGQNEMLDYVSTPAGHHLFAMSGFEQLNDLINLLRNNSPPYTCYDFTKG